MSRLEQFLSDALSEFLAQSWLEAIAVFCAIAYLVLAIRQQKACWIFAGISTAIYVWILFDAKLYMESVLNIFYFAAAIYGFVFWQSGEQQGAGRPVVSWHWHRHAKAIAAVMLLSLLNGYLLTRYTDAAFPYVDSLTTWFAIWTTFLVARKVLENWWYWLVIDAVMVYLFAARGLNLSAALFVLYLAMIPFGYVAWSRSMREVSQK